MAIAVPDFEFWDRVIEQVSLKTWRAYRCTCKTIYAIQFKTEDYIIQDVVIQNPLGVETRLLHRKRFEFACRRRLDSFPPVWRSPWREDKPWYVMRFFFGQVILDYFRDIAWNIVVDASEEREISTSFWNSRGVFTHFLFDQPGFWEVCFAEAPRYVYWPELSGCLESWKKQTDDIRGDGLAIVSFKLTDDLSRWSYNPHVATMFGQYPCESFHCEGVCFLELLDDHICTWEEVYNLVDWVLKRPHDNRFFAVDCVKHLIPPNKPLDRSWLYSDVRVEVSRVYWLHRIREQAIHKRLSFWEKE